MGADLLLNKYADGIMAPFVSWRAFQLHSADHIRIEYDILFPG